MTTLPPFNNGACADHDAEDWHAEGRGRKVKNATKRAKAVCAGCPALTLCLTWQLDHEGDLSAGSRHGVYGGLTGRERARLARGAA